MLGQKKIKLYMYSRKHNWSSQAELQPVIDYLAGCKHLKPPGRWDSWWKTIGCNGQILWISSKQYTMLIYVGDTML